MNSLYIPLFEYGSYIIWGLYAVYLLARGAQRRTDLWLLLGLSLSFPFEWFADEYWLFLSYNEEFTPMFGTFPLFMPFAWGWFYAIPIAVMATKSESISRKPLLFNITWMFAAFFIWDVVVETFGTANNLWTYAWSSSAFQAGGLPLYVPFWLGVQLPLYYYAHLWARTRSKDMHWLPGFSLHVAVYYAIGGAVALGGWVMSNLILGIAPGS